MPEAAVFENHYLVLVELEPMEGYDPDWDVDLIHPEGCPQNEYKTCACHGAPHFMNLEECPNVMEYSDPACGPAWDVEMIGFEGLADQDGNLAYGYEAGWKPGAIREWRIEPGVYRLHWEMPAWSGSMYEDPPDSNFYIVEKVADSREEWEANAPSSS